MDVDLVQASVQFFVGLVIGSVSGFLTKKIVKVTLVIGVAGLGVGLYLDYADVIDVDRELIDTVSSISYEEELTMAQSALYDVFSVLPVGIGFTIGVFFGFKRA